MIHGSDIRSEDIDESHLLEVCVLSPPLILQTFMFVEVLFAFLTSSAGVTVM